MSYHISILNDPSRPKNGHGGNVPEVQFNTDDDELGQSYSGAFLNIDDGPGIGERRVVGATRTATLRNGKIPKDGLRESLHRQTSMAQLISDEQEESISRFVFLSRFQFFFFVLPMFISLWYSVAVLFPPEYRTGKWSLLLWTPGNLIVKDGSVKLCPRASICSEGVFQIILISISRLTAFASYVTMGITFVSKMHSSVRMYFSSELF